MSAQKWVPVAMSLVLASQALAASSETVVSPPRAPTRTGPASLSIEVSSPSFADTVQVRVSSGVVTLSGTVPSLEDKERALRAVRGIAGLRSVVDQLVVAPTSQNDEIIQSQVEEALRNLTPSSSNDQIQIEVSGGVAHLTGVAHSAEEKQAYERLARDMHGVRSVRNDLRVSR